MDFANKEALLARREATGSGFPEEDVEVPGFGTVRVRGLSRHEVMHAQAVHAKGAAVLEQRVVSLGMVEPQMTEDDVKRWQRVSTGQEMELVTTTIARLSGMTEGADKQAYKDFEADPGASFAYFLAQKLGMTVARLEAEMSNAEFIGWTVYYGRKAQKEEMARLRRR